jgi:hypothetical protein
MIYGFVYCINFLKKNQFAKEFSISIKFQLHVLVNKLYVIENYRDK